MNKYLKELRGGSMNLWCFLGLFLIKVRGDRCRDEALAKVCICCHVNK